MKRWAPICQRCFEEAFPGAYCPELTTYDDCYVCGESTIVTHVNPGDLPEHFIDHTGQAAPLERNDQ